jgi:hypothetical protein
VVWQTESIQTDESCTALHARGGDTLPPYYRIRHNEVNHASPEGEPMFKGGWHIKVIFDWEDLRAVSDHGKQL